MRPHGTRAKYVAEKCRCELCRKANCDYNKKRLRQMKKLARKYEVAEAKTRKYVSKAIPLKGSPGTMVMRRCAMRRCPGVNGEPCKNDRYLKSNSTGSICSDCRERLLHRKMLPAARAKQHLLMLAHHGIGRRTIEEASGLNGKTVADIRAGRQTWILPSTQARILKVNTKAKSDDHFIGAQIFWKLVRELQKKAKMGKGEIAARLGYTGYGLQIRRGRVKLKTHVAMKKLHAEVMHEIYFGKRVPVQRVTWMIRAILSETKMKRRLLATELGWKDLKPVVIHGTVPAHMADEVKFLYEKYVTGVLNQDTPELCTNCGLSHAKSDRLTRLAKMLPCTLREVMDAYPCVYQPDPSDGPTNKSPMKLFRDMKALRARSTEGTWAIPEFKNPLPPRHKEGEEMTPLLGGSLAEHELA